VRCPYCSDPTNRVIDSRLGREGTEIRRRRECAECGRRFTTRERVDDVLPKIVKRDERREEFQREKLLIAVQKACEKRPVSADDLERLVDRVERHAQELGEKEVTSAQIGERMMEELVALDPLAAARFASVFRNFHGAEDYVAFFASIDAASSGGEHDS
jgi:transcriptional repressor NrdR